MSEIMEQVRRDVAVDALNPADGHPSPAGASDGNIEGAVLAAGDGNGFGFFTEVAELPCEPWLSGFEDEFGALLAQGAFQAGDPLLLDAVCFLGQGPNLDGLLFAVEIFDAREVVGAELYVRAFLRLIFVEDGASELGDLVLLGWSQSHDHGDARM